MCKLTALSKFLKKQGCRDILNYIKEVKLLDFQYKILNRILATNRFLYKIKPIVTDKCWYCKKSESITHIFFSCEKVKGFWKELKKWLLNNANISLKLNFNQVYFLHVPRH